MEAQVDSLAGFQKGQFSLKDFEWEPDLRPCSPPSQACPPLSIPEIDLQALYSLDPPAPPNHGFRSEYASLVSSLSHAASSLGVFQVYNHGIPLSALDSLYSYARRFFSLPLERKYEAAKFLAHPSAGPSGYKSGSSLADSPNKWWTEGLRVASSNKEVILSLAKCLCSEEHEQQAFSDVMEECSNGFFKLAKDLTIVLLEGLGVEGQEVVEKYVSGEIAGLKFNHYPPCSQPKMTLGLPPHSDVSILTILWQDLVGGLQVHVHGEWITMRPRHDVLVVIIGDVFQVWSNDKYLSGLHRATLNARESRYSMVYFYYSGVDSMLAPIQELLEKNKECSKFRSTLLSEHRSYIYSQVLKRGSDGVGYLKC